ncbi:MAG TPA: M20/M25/M40 family metallo-hydrolase [Candidatus Binatia bacterium]|nr:M20/M25/M40 family metallo-hydrolase [Candidatus Binatia bacterium]
MNTVAAAERTVTASALLLEMLAIPSPTGSEWRLAAALRERLEGLGFDAEIDPAGDVVAVWGRGPREVMLLGHLDTVAGTIPPRTEAGWIHGRGAVDAKGPLAAAIGAVVRQPRGSGTRFTVVGCIDEEGDSRGARQVATRPAPECLIVLEPSGWDAVTVGYRGIVRAELRLEDALRHRAAPEPTVGDRLVRLLAGLQEELDRRNAGLTPFRSADLRVTGLAVAGTGLTESATASIQLRLPPEMGTPAVLPWLDARRGPAELLIQFAVDAVHTARDSRLAHALGHAIRRQGGTPRHKLKTGTADMNLLVPRWRCPAVAYGPGDSHLDHTPDEAVEVAEVERATEVLAEALAELAR